MSQEVRVVVVTGLSGAGKSTALHALEDLGYYCADNVPPSLADRAVEVCVAGGIQRIALGIDVRVGAFLESAAEAIAVLRRQEREVTVVFLDAADDVLLKRFNETRRPHPLSPSPSVAPPATPPLPPSVRAREGGSLAVLDGIHRERERLAPLRALATVDFDTTRLSVHDLRRQVLSRLGPSKTDQPRMVTQFLSFGFKYGVPIDADLVFDVRFLDNPYFVPHLSKLPGTDPAVREFVLKNRETQQFAKKVEDLLLFALPRYEREGKSYLTVAVGCTGGRHRSVVIASLIADDLANQTDGPITVVHRDVGRGSSLLPAGKPVETPGAPSTAPGATGGAEP